MRKSKRSMLLIGCVMLLLLLAACGGNNAAQTPAASPGAENSASNNEEPSATTDFSGETLVVQVWGGKYEETLRNHVIPAFEEATGAKVELVLGDSPVAKLKAEGDNPSVDVLHLDAGSAASAIDMGVLAPLNFDNMPNAKDLYPAAKETDYTVATNWGSFGITYRTDLVKTPPAKWEDLWNPEFAGKVAIWEIENASTIEMMDMIARGMGTTITDKNAWDDVFAKMKELKPSIVSFVSAHADLENLLTSGQAIVAVQPNGRAINLIRSGAPVEFVAPSDGSPTVTSLVGIAAGTKKKELAELFVNQLLGTEAQEAYAENNFYAPTNKLAKVPEDLQPLMPYGEDKVEALVTIDQSLLTPLKAELIDRWNREMK